MTAWNDNKIRIVTLLASVFFLGIFSLWVLNDLMNLKDEASLLYEINNQVANKITEAEESAKSHEITGDELLQDVLVPMLREADNLRRDHYRVISAYLNAGAALVFFRSVAVFLLVMAGFYLAYPVFRSGAASGTGTIWEEDSRVPGLSLDMARHELLQSLPIGLIAIDNTGVITTTNVKAEELLEKVEVGSKMPDDEIFDVVRQAEKGDARRAMVTVSGGDKTRRVQVDSYSLSGNRGLVVLLTDKTELMQLEARTLRSEKLSALAKLTAGLSHEINNPVSAISSLAESLLEELPEDSDIRDDMVIIEENAHRCRTIVQRLLDFARPHHSTRLGIDHDPCDLNEILDGILDLAELQEQAAGIVIRRDFAEMLPRLNTDVELLKQMLYNIVQNAIDAVNSGRKAGQATEKGDNGGVITVSTSLDYTSERSSVAIIFRDTGPGIPREIREKIFEPFYTTRAGSGGSGVGMGLAIVSSIAERLGGEVSIESPTGGGATVKVTVPVR